MSFWLLDHLSNDSFFKHRFDRFTLTFLFSIKKNQRKSSKSVKSVFKKNQKAIPALKSNLGIKPLAIKEGITRPLSLNLPE